MASEAAAMLIALLGMVVLTGLVVTIAGMRQRTRMLEMQHRERLAMIEKGLLPSPELDPSGFAQGGWREKRQSTTAVRMQSVGIIVIGFGLAIATVISVASEEPTVGIGVGGAIAILGVAFVVNALVTGHQTATWHHPPTPGGAPPGLPPNPPPTLPE